LDGEVGCPNDVRESREKRRTGECPHVALFCCLSGGKFSVVFVRIGTGYGILGKVRKVLPTPRAKTTVIALQPVPSVKPFSVVEEPRVPVLFVAAAEMSGTESRRRLKEERILKSWK
jgi:hypothetical protein